MNRKEILLTIMAEECMEVAQRITKAIRFGLNEVQEGQKLSNVERINYEFMDLMTVATMLEEEGHLKLLSDPYHIQKEAMENKRAKVEKYLQYSRELGILKEETI